MTPTGQRSVRPCWIDPSWTSPIARGRGTAPSKPPCSTSRRRVWALIRRSGTEGLSRTCPTCRSTPDERDTSRVLTLCLDAACALLVADAVPDDLIALRTTPVQALIPLQRRP